MESVPTRWLFIGITRPLPPTVFAFFDRYDTVAKIHLTPTKSPDFVEPHCGQERDSNERLNQD